MPNLKEILSRRSPVLHVLGPERQVRDAVRIMAEHEVGAVLIEEEGELVGIFSERDLLRRVVAVGASLEKPIGDVMTRNPVTIDPDEDRSCAIEKMQSLNCRHLPVVANGKVLDTVSIRDLVFDEIRDGQYEIAELNRYIHGAW